MKIVVFADVHYFGGDMEKARFNTQKKLVKYAIPLLDKLTETVNADDTVGACVNLGDIIQDTCKKELDIVCLEYMFNKLKNIKCPCYSILGNHDLKMMDSVEEVESILGYRSTYSVDMGGYHLVFLTTEVRPELGFERGGCYRAQYLSDESLQWLQKDLAENELPCLIFTHYGVAEEPELTDECMFMKNRDAVKRILVENKNILAVFSGHQHRTTILEEDGIKYYLLGSLTGCTEKEGVPDGEYLELELCDGGLEVNLRRVEVTID